MGHSDLGNASVETSFSDHSRLQLPVNPDRTEMVLEGLVKVKLSSSSLPHSKERSLTEWVDEFIIFRGKKTDDALSRKGIDSNVKVKPCNIRLDGK